MPSAAAVAGGGVAGPLRRSSSASNTFSNTSARRLRRPQVDFGILVGVDDQLDLVRRAGDLRPMRTIWLWLRSSPPATRSTAAICRTRRLVVGVEPAEVVVLVLRLGAAMVAGHVGDELQLLGPERLAAGCAG